MATMTTGSKIEAPVVLNTALRDLTAQIAADAAWNRRFLAIQQDPDAPKWRARTTLAEYQEHLVERLCQITTSPLTSTP